MKAMKRFYVVFDADGILHRSRRVSAGSRKQALTFMKVIYGDSVRVRFIEEGF